MNDRNDLDLAQKTKPKLLAKNASKLPIKQNGSRI